MYLPTVCPDMHQGHDVQKGIASWAEYNFATTGTTCMGCLRARSLNPQEPPGKHTCTWRAMPMDGRLSAGRRQDAPAPAHQRSHGRRQKEPAPAVPAGGSEGQRRLASPSQALPVPGAPARPCRRYTMHARTECLPAPYGFELGSAACLTSCP